MQDITKDQQDAVRKFAEEQFDNLKTNRATLEDKWRTRWKLYQSYVKESSYPFVSSYFQPETYSLCKKKIAKIVEFMFSTGRILEATPNNHKDQMAYDNAQNNEDLMLNQFERMKLRKRIIEIMGWAVPLGTAFGKVRWHKEERKIKSPVYNEQLDRVEYEFMDKVVYDDPMLDIISPWNIYIDRAAESLDDVGGLCHAYVLNEVELKQKKNDGWINTELKADREDDDTGAENLIKETDDDTPTREGIFKPMAIIHYWGTISEKLAELFDANEGDEFEIVYNRDRGVLHYAGLNSEPHGLRPFIVFRDKPDSGRFYGEGEIEAIKDLQFELNDTCNWANDLMNQTANPLIIHSSDVTDRMQSFVFGANGRLEVDDPSQVMINYPKNIPVDIWNKITFMRESMEAVMGMHRYEQGGAPTRSETASGIMMLQRAAQSQHALEVMMMEEEGLERLAQMVCALNQENILEERVIKRNGIQGEKGTPKFISPEDITGDFGFKFLGAIKQQHLDSVRSNFPVIYEATKFDNKVNKDVMLRGLFEAIGIQDPTRYLTDPNEDRRLAAMENVALVLEGKMPPPQPDEDHETHVAIHETLMQYLANTKKMKELELMQQHIGDHTQYLYGGTPTAQQRGSEKKGTNEKGTGSDTPSGVGDAKAQMNRSSSG